MNKFTFPLKYFFAILFSCSILLFSACKKDKTLDEPAIDTTPIEEPNNAAPINSQAIEGKWAVGSNSGKLAVNTSGYTLFEFTQNKGYIISKSDNTYLEGFYTIDESNSTITLGTFGVITIKKIESSILDFTLRLTGTTTDINIFSSKSGSELANSNKTDSLCQTWILQTRYINGVEQTALRDYIINGNFSATLILTTYGTYFGVTEMTGSSTTYENGQWAWTDETETSICGGTTGSCTNNAVSISNGTLILTLVEGNQTTVTIYTKVQQ